MITSAIGLFYYLRVVVALYSHTEDLVAPGIPMEPRGVWSLTWTVGVLTAAIVAIGCYPSPGLTVNSEHDCSIAIANGFEEE